MLKINFWKSPLFVHEFSQNFHEIFFVQNCVQNENFCCSLKHAGDEVVVSVIIVDIIRRVFVECRFNGNKIISTPFVTLIFTYK
jgi:hypothetical protein